MKNILWWGYTEQTRNVDGAGYRICVDMQDVLAEAIKGLRRSNAHVVMVLKRLLLADGEKVVGDHMEALSRVGSCQMDLSWTESALELYPLVMFSLGSKLKALELSDDVDAEALLFSRVLDGLEEEELPRVFGVNADMWQAKAGIVDHLARDAAAFFADQWNARAGAIP